MGDELSVAPESSAVRVALWRALHVQIDPPPHALTDEIGLQLADPDEGWRSRGDMHPEGTRTFRASIAARSRFIEDLVVEQAERGGSQYVILGAGLDTFAQRRPDLAVGHGLRIFEVDQPGPQAWKRRRLLELGYPIPAWLRLVPVDFEAGGSWFEQVTSAGFDAARPTVVASAGVSLYLTKDATAATLRQIAALAPGSTVAMTFLLPLDLLDAAERPGRQAVENAARASGTPFIGFYSPNEMLALAKEAGFREARHVSGAELIQRYFPGRADLRAASAEEMLVASI
jgi:methyltransferase (TIGR00027 family)